MGSKWMLQVERSGRVGVSVEDGARLGSLHVQSYHHGQSWRLLAPPVTMVSLILVLGGIAAGSEQ